MQPRTFLIIRNFDENGISGTGTVAEGVVFHNGKAIICWISDTSMTEFADNIQDWIDIHVLSHPKNKTEIHWSTGEVQKY